MKATIANNVIAFAVIISIVVLSCSCNLSLRSSSANPKYKLDLVRVSKPNAEAQKSLSKVTISSTQVISKQQSFISVKLDKNICLNQIQKAGILSLKKGYNLNTGNKTKVKQVEKYRNNF